MPRYTLFYAIVFVKRSFVMPKRKTVTGHIVVGDIDSNTLAGAAAMLVSQHLIDDYRWRHISIGDSEGSVLYERSNN